MVSLTNQRRQKPLNSRRLLGTTAPAQPLGTRDREQTDDRRDQEDYLEEGGRGIASAQIKKAAIPQTSRRRRGVVVGDSEERQVVFGQRGELRDREGEHEVEERLQRGHPELAMLIGRA